MTRLIACAPLPCSLLWNQVNNGGTKDAGAGTVCAMQPDVDEVSHSPISTYPFMGWAGGDSHSNYMAHAKYTETTKLGHTMHELLDDVCAAPPLRTVPSAGSSGWWGGMHLTGCPFLRGLPFASAADVLQPV